MSRSSSLTVSRHRPMILALLINRSPTRGNVSFDLYDDASETENRSRIDPDPDLGEEIRAHDRNPL